MECDNQECLDNSQHAPGFLLTRSRTDSTFEQIPVMWAWQYNLNSFPWRTGCRDFTNIANPDPVVRRGLANRIRDACVNVGFFYSQLSFFLLLDKFNYIAFILVKNHGISEEIISSVLDAVKRFFELPEKMKQEVRNFFLLTRPRALNVLSYSSTSTKVQISRDTPLCLGRTPIQRIKEISMRVLTWDGSKRTHLRPGYVKTELWLARMSGPKACLVSDHLS